MIYFKIVLDFLYSIKYIDFMRKKTTKMGRPPLKEKDKRKALITLRLKTSERKALEKDAKAKGLSISSYLLECWQKSKRR